MAFCFLLAVCVVLLPCYAMADMGATVEDTSGSKVVLNKLTTTTIKVQVGSSQQEIRFALIKSIVAQGKPGQIKITLNSGKVIAGKSTSLIKGVWELGQYTIPMNKVKNLTLKDAKPAPAWKKPKGYMATVTDVNGTAMDVYGMGFGYSYSYTMSNCIFNCSKTANTSIYALPLNQGPGAMIIPFDQLASLENITNVSKKKYNTELQATAMLKNGKKITAKFGNFGGERLDNVVGKTELGDYKLALKQAKKIVFNHQNANPPLPSETWGKKQGGLKVKLVCTAGIDYQLMHAWVVKPADKGTVSKFSTHDTQIKVKIGEAENQIPLEKLAELQINKTAKNKYSHEYPCTLKTKSGNQVKAKLQDRRFLSGFTSEGRFFYIPLQEIKSLSLQ